MTATDIRKHVDFLSAHPRNRHSHPTHLDQARNYVNNQLTAAGWATEIHDFRNTWVIGNSEAGLGKILPYVLHHNVTGHNILATRPGQTSTGILLIAQRN